MAQMITRTYVYPGSIINIHDGDTMKLLLDLGCSVYHKETLRLYGINAPELNTPDGKAALAALMVLITQEFPPGNTVDPFPVSVQTFKDETEKYGRLLARVTLPSGIVINDWMVSNGHAKPYFGEGPKPV